MTIGHKEWGENERKWRSPLEFHNICLMKSELDWPWFDRVGGDRKMYFLKKQYSIFLAPFYWSASLYSGNIDLIDLFFW